MHHFNKDKDQVDDLIFHKLLKWDCQMI
jgi:hypothetical protein